MAKVTFISDVYLKNNSPINLNVESEYCKIIISQAQDLHMDRILGSTLYRAIQNQISANTLTALNQVLLEDYIQIALVYHSLAKFILVGVKFNQKGINQQKSENEEPISEERYRLIIDEIKNAAQYYDQRIINYLKEHITSYAEYQSPGSGWDIIQPNRSTTYFQGMHLPRTIDDCEFEYIFPNHYRGNIEI